MKFVFSKIPTKSTLLFPLILFLKTFFSFLQKKKRLYIQLQFYALFHSEFSSKIRVASEYGNRWTKKRVQKVIST